MLLDDNTYAIKNFEFLNFELREARTIVLLRNLKFTPFFLRGAP
jgi:hypothetical protein